MGIKVRQRGNFNNTTRFLKRAKQQTFYDHLSSIAQRGVDALSSATPIDSGLTAASWSYQILIEEDQVRIVWSNSNRNDGFNVAIGIQYGHGTNEGQWIEGIDYINPSMRPIFIEIINSVWDELRNS